MSTPYYALQSAFNAGEVSADILSRTDLDKYQFALSKAENVIIKPYGGISKRFGTRYIGQTKYADKKAILVKFSESGNTAFMLECGHEYVRIWKDANYTGIEIPAPWREADLKYLRFTQSANTMFICSKNYPVQVLKRDMDNWNMGEFEPDYPCFDTVNLNVIKYGEEYKTPGTYTFVPRFSGRYKIEIVGAGGGGYKGRIRIGFLGKYELFSGGNGDKKTIEVDLVEGKPYQVTVGLGGICGYRYDTEEVDANGYIIWGSIPAKAGTQSAFESHVALGGGAASEQYNGTSAGNALGGMGGYWYKSGGSTISPEYSKRNSGNGYILVSYAGNNAITPSAKEGLNIEVSSKLDTFNEKQVGSYIKLCHEIPSITVSITNGTSQTLAVGQSWKLVTHGLWSGILTVEKSSDMSTWTEYRKYTGSEDFNASESGTFLEHGYLRVAMNIGGGSCTADITALPYTHEGYAKIIKYISPTKINVNVREPFGSTESTETFAFSAWSDLNGYPACSCFFQDRLVFAANNLYPYMIWLSRSGDYYNFKVEKADGKVLDDSAITLPVISREQFNINHLVPSQDLIILTDGNEWILSGSSVVTPTNAYVKMQTSRGSNEVEPQIIGNRIIYVQRRGGTVRDMGYTFESDNYVGDDLTQLAKHLVSGYELTDSTFAQEPYSIIYFTRSDGIILCLTYIREQKVYAWSRLTTNGAFESVVSIPTEKTDQVYTIVQRLINGQAVKYIELFEQQPESTNIVDYCMMDSAVIIHNETPQNIVSRLYHMAGEKVQVIADGRLLPEKTVGNDATITLETPANKVIVGMQYNTTIEQPNFEIQTKDGTLQGRNALISNVVMRLENSIGGQIGTCMDALDDIAFEELLDIGEYPLFTGDKQITLPATFSKSTKVCIKHNQPYPFSINAIIRQVTFGG